MIKPYISKKLNSLFVKDDSRRKTLLRKAEKIPSVIISSAAASNAVMLACGYFNPLTRFMNLREVISIAENMHLPSGELWPVPIVNMIREKNFIEKLKKSDREIALRDPNVNGNPVIAIQSVEKIEKIDDNQLLSITEKIFGTASFKHPGVATFIDSGNTLISGKIEVLNYSYFYKDFPETFKTAFEIREEISKRGWKKVVAFQTRNPMHRAHEELCRLAKKKINADGILIHMVLGKLQKGDVPAKIRDESIKKMVQLYFPKNTVMVAGYGFDMLYAGPREAVLHAIFRQNSGCSHFIVGRDHAGVGNFYGTFDSQRIFNRLPKKSLQIEIFCGEKIVWCQKCENLVMISDCYHSNESHIDISGTKIRKLLSHGKTLPQEFSRPEVSKILLKYYKKFF